MKIKFSRHFVGCPSSVVVSKNASGEYYVSMLVETDIKPLEIVNSAGGGSTPIVESLLIIIRKDYLFVL